MKKKSIRSTALSVKRCYSCKDGRIMRHKNIIFCGFCGKEFPRAKL